MGSGTSGRVRAPAARRIWGGCFLSVLKGKKTTRRAWLMCLKTYLQEIIWQLWNILEVYSLWFDFYPRGFRAFTMDPDSPWSLATLWWSRRMNVAWNARMATEWLVGGDWLPWILHFPINIGLNILVGGWEHFLFSQKYWVGNNHPNWRTPSFFRGVAQPPTRICGRLSGILFRGSMLPMLDLWYRRCFSSTAGCPCNKRFIALWVNN